MIISGLVNLALVGALVWVVRQFLSAWPTEDGAREQAMIGVLEKLVVPTVDDRPQPVGEPVDEDTAMRAWVDSQGEVFSDPMDHVGWIGRAGVPRIPDFALAHLPSMGEDVSDEELGWPMDGETWGEAVVEGEGEDGVMARAGFAWDGIEGLGMDDG